MLIEYTSCNFSSIRWASSEQSGALSAAASSERYLVAASAETEPEAQLKIYSFQDTIDDVQLVAKCSHRLDNAVTQLVTFGRDLVFAVGVDSSAHLLSVTERAGEDGRSYSMQQLQMWKNLDRYQLNDLSYCKQSNSVVAVGGEGKLITFDLSTSTPTHKISKKISHSSINCVEHLNRNELVVGNETGDLKLFDIRTGNVEMSLAQKLSSLECVRRHHSNGHIVSCGNDLGLLSIWDLRNQAENLDFVSAHDYAITALQYVFTETNSALSSSLDGQLLKWNFSADNRLQNVQCVFGSKGNSAITSFDLSVGGRLAFFTDLESLYVMSL